MDPNVIRASEARELIAAIPYQLGFAPRESLVAVSLRGDARMGLVARVDLSDLGSDQSGAAVARGLGRHLLADGAVGVLVVIYTESPKDLASHTGHAWRALITMRSGVRHGLVAEEWWVGPNGYGAVGCADRACCPPGGRPLVDLQSTQVAAHMVLVGATVEGSREQMAVRGRASSGARRSAARAATDERGRHREALGRGERDSRRWAAGALARWDGLCRRVGEGHQLPAATLGRAAVALEDTRVRDSVLARNAVGPALGRNGLDAESGAAVLFGSDTGAPDPEGLRPLRGVLTSVVEHMPPRRAVPALTLLACLAWWEGDGARAGVLAGQALELDPRYRLAVLVADVLSRGVAPAWARPENRSEGSGAGVEAR